MRNRLESFVESKVSTQNLLWNTTDTILYYVAARVH